MKKYLVNLPVGTKDFEFQQCLDLLIKEGYIDSERRTYVRARQPDGSYREQGFLYLFDDRDEAERFAAKLREVSHNPEWHVYDIDLGEIRDLIEEHRELRDQPLMLAMLFDSGDDPRKTYLLEVIDNFGFNEISPDRELFEVSFPVPGRFASDGSDLHLILTNPPEFDAALREDWEWAKAIRRAVNEGRFEVLFMTDEGSRSRELIHA